MASEVPFRQDGKRVLYQRILWIPPNPSGAETVGDGLPPIVIPYPTGWPERPNLLLVWNLPYHTNRASPPDLPFEPRHGKNAAIDNHMDDWRISGGKFHYYSHYALNEGGHWLLLESKTP
jgi:hypothetical protein